MKGEAFLNYPDVIYRGNGIVEWRGRSLPDYTVRDFIKNTVFLPRPMPMTVSYKSWNDEVVTESVVVLARNGETEVLCLTGGKERWFSGDTYSWNE